jgi:hypothetical protein
MWKIKWGTDPYTSEGSIRIWLSDRFYMHFIYKKS